MTKKDREAMRRRLNDNLEGFQPSAADMSVIEREVDRALRKARRERRRGMLRVARALEQHDALRHRA